MSEINQIIEVIETEITEGFAHLAFKEKGNEDSTVSSLLNEIENQELAGKLDDAIGELLAQKQNWAFSKGFELGSLCQKGIPIEIQGVKLRIIPDNFKPGNNK